MSNLLSRLGNGLADVAGLAGRGVLGIGTLGMSEALRMAAEQKKKEQQQQIAQIGNVVSGEQIPNFLRPGQTTESMTPEQFESAKTQQLYNLGTPEAAAIAGKFLETPESRLNKANVENEIATRNAQIGLKKEELALTREDKLRNYNLAARELEAKLKGGLKDPKDIFEMESKLRNEFVTQSKDYITQRDAVDKINTAAVDPSAAGDISLIYGFMKLNDPGSTVREGEYATAQNAGSIPERVRSMYNKALTGERLDSKVRNDFVDRSQRLFSGAQRQHDKRTGEYKGLAERAGINTDQVILDLGLAQDKQPRRDTITDGVIATNNQTGQKVIRKGGKWLPL